MPKTDAELTALIKEVRKPTAHNRAPFDPEGPICGSDEARRLGQCQEPSHFGPPCAKCVLLADALTEARDTIRRVTELMRNDLKHNKHSSGVLHSFAPGYIDRLNPPPASEPTKCICRTPVRADYREPLPEPDSDCPVHGIQPATQPQAEARFELVEALKAAIHEPESVARLAAETIVHRLDNYIAAAQTGDRRALDK